MEKVLAKMMKANRYLGYMIDTDLREVGMTGPQVFMLRLILKNGQLTVSEIAEKTGSDRPTVSAIFNRLYDRGILTKVENKEDRRSFYITIAEDQKQFVIDCFNIVKNAVKRFYSALSKEELETLEKIMDKLPRRENCE